MAKLTVKDRGPEDLPAQPMRWKEIWPYALLSLVAFVCAFTLLTIFNSHADKIVALGLTGKLYYIVLIPLGLCVSAFLFGALRSYGIYRGILFGGHWKIGGPAVGFFLVIVLGFVLPKPPQNFSLTVIVHGPKGNSDMVLRSSGAVILDTGELRRTAHIGPNGEAIFPEIPANMRGKKALVGVDAKGFELTDPQTELTLSPATFYLEIHRKPGWLIGHVFGADGQPLAGVTLSVGEIQASTNVQGYFEMRITDEDANSDVTLVATKPGFKTWTGLEVPNSNEITIPLDKAR